MSVLNRRVHDTYRKLDGTVMCECNCQASLKVSQSPLNPGRPFFTCRNKDGCRFFQWADVKFKRRTAKTVQRIRQVLKLQRKKNSIISVNNVHWIQFII